MSEDRRVVLALSQCSKGKIQYDPNWHREGRLKEVLAECTSPPILPQYRSGRRASVENKDDVAQEGLSWVEYDTDSDYADTPDNLSQDDIDTSEKPVNGQSAQSPGLDRSDLERQIIIAKKALQEEQEEYRKEAMLLVETRKRLYDDHTKMLTRQVEEQWCHLKVSKETEVENTIKQTQKDHKQMGELSRQRQQQLKEQHRQMAKTLNTKMQQAQQKQKEKDEIERRKQQELKDHLARLEDAQKQFLLVKAQVSQTLANCQNQNDLPKSVMQYPEVMLNLSQQVEGILQDVRNRSSSKQNVEKLTEYLNKAMNILEFVRKQVELADKKQQEVLQEQQKQQQAAADAAAAAAAKKQQHHTESQATSSQRSVSSAAQASSDPNAPVILVNSVFRDSLSIYTKVSQLQHNTEKCFHKLVSDPVMKKHKFELQKAINTLINTISPDSGHHLREKLNKIHALLSGQSAVIGSNKVSPKDYEGGVEFCRDLFAKKIVSQGETQVSAQLDSAFAFAAVAVGVWCEVPEVGDLIMAHFYLKCPYIVPYYVPKRDGQSAEEFYRSLGYTYEDGEMEKQDMFLKRMTGLMRLYAAMIVSSPPKPNCPHPHGLEKAWSWLAQIINIDPRPDITATMIHDFLQVTAFDLFRVFKKQFLKLIEIIIKEYLPKIHSVTLQGSGGPVSRLEIYLEKLLKGQVSPPKGLLSRHFWLT